MVLVSGTTEKTWTETHTVAAGDTRAASGGRLGVSEIHVSGSFVVQSCCGYLTNDIMFAISNLDGSSQSYGVVVGTFTFEWNTSTSSEYSLVFNDIFGESSPSYHTKTIKVSVTEVSQLEPSNTLLPTPLGLYLVIGLIAGAGSVSVLAFLLLRKKSR